MAERTVNTATVERYLDGFRRTDRPLILSCLADDVEWLLPGVFHIRGKDEYAKHIVDEGFVDRPEITVTHWIEVADVVVVEGAVRTQRADGNLLSLAFCDVFELKNGKIQRLRSYLMETR